MITPVKPLALAAAALTLFVAHSAFAATAVSWTNSQGTNLWSEGMNWSNGTSPDGDFDVTIGAPAPTNLDVSPSIAHLNVLAAGILNIRSGKILTLTQGGTLGVAGLISLNPEGASSIARLQLPNSDITLSGAGSIVLNGLTNGTFAEIVGTAFLNVPANHTISGSGTLNVSVQNSGLVAASGGTLVLARQNGNAGTFMATNGGRLEITGGITGGQIVADGGSVALGNGGLIDSSTLSTANAGGILTNGPDSTLRNVTNNGGFVIARATTVHLEGSQLVNNGQILIFSRLGGAAILTTQFDKTISGTGSIVLQSTISQITSDNAVVTQAAGHTIRGGGTISTAFSNNGVIQAEYSTVTLSATNILENSATGVLRAINGATLAVSQGGNLGTVDVGSGSTFSHTSLFSNTGLLRLGFDGGTGSLLVANGLTINQGGTLMGNGTVTGSITNSGLIAPGLSVGRLNLTSSLSLTSSSRVTIEIGGSVQGVSYDFLNVSGTVAFGGQLELRLANGFVPGDSDLFTILTSSGTSGSFANVTDGQRLATSDGAGSFLVHYGNGSNTVTLSNFAIPEPSTNAILFAGAAALLIVRKPARRRVS